MSEVDEIEYQRGRAIGREVMQHRLSEMAAIEAQLLELVAGDGDPARIFRARIGLADRGMAEVDRVTDQVLWLTDGAASAEVMEAFAGARVELEQTRRNVVNQLIQVVAQLN